MTGGGDGIATAGAAPEPPAGRRRAFPPEGDWPRVLPPLRFRPEGWRASAYAWRRWLPLGVVALVDLAAPGRLSVTNDAEGVVADLVALVGPDALAAAPLVAYRDGEGAWDGLAVEQRTLAFSGFVFLRAWTEEEAVARAAAHLARNGGRARWDRAA